MFDQVLMRRICLRRAVCVNCFVLCILGCQLSLYCVLLEILIMAFESKREK